MSVPTNKLSVYLIKESRSDVKDIFDDIDSLTPRKIDDNSTLYYTGSLPKPPAWLGRFFGPTVANSLSGALYSAYVSAVLLVQIPIDGKVQRFAITFGLGGHQLLASGSFEERFGLMCTLNLVSPESLRSIDKSNMGLSPKQAREQINKAGDIADFGIDIEQDLVKAVTGTCTDSSIGSTVTGKDSLHISSKTDMSNLTATLEMHYRAFRSDTYKTNFSWIDQVAEIKDPNLRAALDERLVEGISNRNTSTTIWLAVPEVIEWADVKGFYYQGGVRTFVSDLYLGDLIDHFEAITKNLDLQALKDQRINVVSASNEHVIGNWRAYNCLYAEIEHEDELYILNNGKWYCVNRDFVGLVNKDYDEILGDSTDLPNFNDADEGAYNIRAARELGLTCMDAKNISYGGGHSKIEFCDLFDHPGRRLIHVKRYGGSSVLSHLFNQGVVSAQLMLSDEPFRREVNGKLPGNEQFTPVKNRPNPGEYEVIFAVISGVTKPLNVPFFSKVSLRNARRNLELFGIKKISLVKVSESN